MSTKQCPHCKTKKPMVKTGKAYLATGPKQRWLCTNKPCRRITINPLESK